MMLEEKYGLSAEVIDARSVVPFNYDLDVIHEKVLPLPGHVSKTAQNNRELARTRKLGV